MVGPCCNQEFSKKNLENKFQFKCFNVRGNKVRGKSMFDTLLVLSNAECDQPSVNLRTEVSVTETECC